MDVFIKYVWIKLLTDKKAKTVIENYINLNESNVNQINDGSIKEGCFTISLYNDG